VKNYEKVALLYILVSENGTLYVSYKKVKYHACCSVSTKCCEDEIFAHLGFYAALIGG
jgi:hypothetical protein